MQQAVQRTPRDLELREGYQSPDDPLEFIMSTATKDNLGDVIEQDGWDLSAFEKNPIALYNHRSGDPIGIWDKVRVVGGKLRGHLKLAKPGTSRVVDDVRRLVEQRILRAVSVGFRPLQWEPMEKTDGIRFIKNKLLECSLVTVPANSEALSVAKSLNLSSETLELLTGEPAPKSRFRRSIIGEPASAKSKSKARAGPMKISDRIVAAEEEIADHQKSIQEILEASETEERDLTAEEQAQIDDLTADVETKQAQLESLQKAEKAMARREVAKEAARETVNRLTVPAQPAKKEPPGQLLIKKAVCEFIAFAKRRTAEDVQRSHYPDDKRVETIVKAATVAADTTTAGWAAELVDDTLAGFINALQPLSVYGPLRAMGMPLNFDGYGSIKVPRRAGTLTDVAGSFVGEDVPIPVKSAVTASTTLYPYKMAVISTFTRELAERSTPQIEQFLRQAMLDDTANALDAALLDGAAASSGVRPASILNGITGTATAGATTANIITDLKVLLNVLAAANAGRAPAFLIHPSRLLGLNMATTANGDFLFRDELAQGRLMGARVISSTNVPAAQVVVIDAADFAAANGSPIIDVNSSATLVMADDDGVAPDMPIRVDEAPTTTPATQVHSLFQQDRIAIRLILPTSWGLVRTGTVHQITSAAW